MASPYDESFSVGVHLEHTCFYLGHRLELHVSLLCHHRNLGAERGSRPDVPARVEELGCQQADQKHAFPGSPCFDPTWKFPSS